MISGSDFHDYNTGPTHLLTETLTLIAIGFILGAIPLPNAEYLHRASGEPETIHHHIRIMLQNHKYGYPQRLTGNIRIKSDLILPFDFGVGHHATVERNLSGLNFLGHSSHKS